MTVRFRFSKKSPNRTFLHFNELLSIQIVNVARFARNVEWDFFYDFQTLCDLEKIDSEFPPAVKCSLIDNLSGKIPVLWPCPYCLRCGLSQETRWESLALLCHLAPIFKIPGFLNQFYQKWTHENRARGNRKTLKTTRYSSICLSTKTELSSLSQKKLVSFGIFVINLIELNVNNLVTFS